MGNQVERRYVPQFPGRPSRQQTFRPPSGPGRQVGRKLVQLGIGQLATRYFGPFGGLVFDPLVGRAFDRFFPQEPGKIITQPRTSRQTQGSVPPGTQPYLPPFPQPPVIPPSQGPGALPPFQGPGILPPAQLPGVPPPPSPPAGGGPGISSAGAVVGLISPPPPPPPSSPPPPPPPAGNTVTVTSVTTITSGGIGLGAIGGIGLCDGYLTRSIDRNGRWYYPSPFHKEYF